MSVQQFRVLSGTILVAAVVMAALSIHWLRSASEEAIAANEADLQWRELSVVLPAEQRLAKTRPFFENEPLPDFVTGAFQAVDGSFVVMRALAKSCYVEDLEFAIALDGQGVVLGTQVLRHSETPGIGATVLDPPSSWLQVFSGQRAQNAQQREWNFASEGGHFDAVSGATVTSACVLEGVGQVLRWYSRWIRQ